MSGTASALVLAGCMGFGGDDTDDTTDENDTAEPTPRDEAIAAFESLDSELIDWAEPDTERDRDDIEQIREDISDANDYIAEAEESAALEDFEEFYELVVEDHEHTLDAFDAFEPDVGDAFLTPERIEEQVSATEEYLGELSEHREMLEDTHDALSGDGLAAETTLESYLRYSESELEAFRSFLSTTESVFAVNYYFEKGSEEFEAERWSDAEEAFSEVLTHAEKAQGQLDELDAETLSVFGDDVPALHDPEFDYAADLEDAITGAEDGRDAAELAQDGNIEEATERFESVNRGQ